jgi:glycine/D-amino acid oxidase-like deaminating enzyme
LPGGVHVRPEGGGDSKTILIVWDYHAEPVEPVFPPSFDPIYRDVALRGLSTMIPGMEAYFERSSRPAIDGGYYTKTRENRPLIGPVPVTGAYVIGAMSGFGLMAAMAAGELVAAHILGSDLPSYAPSFSPQRYDDPEYLRLLDSWPDTGQL